MRYLPTGTRVLPSAADLHVHLNTDEHDDLDQLVDSYIVAAADQIETVLGYPISYSGAKFYVISDSCFELPFNVLNITEAKDKDVIVVIDPLNITKTTRSVKVVNDYLGKLEVTCTLQPKILEGIFFQTLRTIVAHWLENREEKMIDKKVHGHEIMLRNYVWYAN
jgi:hypothetical protein